jgi:hypothetical protein
VHYVDHYTISFQNAWSLQHKKSRSNNCHFVVNKQAAFLQTASSVVTKGSCHMQYEYRVFYPKSSATQKLQSLPHHANYVGGHRLLFQTAEAG